MEELEKKIDELLEVTKENNHYLRKMHRAQVWAGVFRFCYWAIIIGGTIGAWYYFQPMLDQYLKNYQQLMGNVEKMTGTKMVGSEQLQQLQQLLGK